MPDRYHHKPSATDLLHDLTRIFESGTGFSRTHTAPTGPIERIFGAVEEFKTSPDWDPERYPDDDPMPVFVIKAKDDLASRTVSEYVWLLETHGMHDDARDVRLARAEIDAWRERNPTQCKLPDHKHVPVRRSGSSSEGL